MLSFIKTADQNIRGWRVAAIPGLLLLLLYGKRGWCGQQMG